MSPPPLHSWPTAGCPRSRGRCRRGARTRSTPATAPARTGSPGSPRSPCRPWRVLLISPRRGGLRWVGRTWRPRAGSGACLGTAGTRPRRRNTRHWRTRTQSLAGPGQYWTGSLLWGMNSDGKMVWTIREQWMRNIESIFFESPDLIFLVFDVFSGYWHTKYGKNWYFMKNIYSVQCAPEI